MSSSLFGLPLLIESDDADALNVVSAVIAEYGGLIEQELVGESLRVRVTVGAAQQSEFADNMQISELGGGGLRIEASNAHAIVDPLTRSAEISAGAATLRDVSEAAVLALVSCFDRHPVHASAVVHEGHALLLAGPSGAGKSTLAHMASGAGYKFLSDDCIRIQLEPHFRVWGSAARVRMLGNASEKSVIEIQRSLGSTVTHADRASVCILARGESASLQPLSPDQVRAALAAQLAPGFDRFPDRVDAVFKALSQPGGWLLTLSRDPQDALPLMRAVLEGDHA